MSGYLTQRYVTGYMAVLIRVYAYTEEFETLIVLLTRTDIVRPNGVSAASSCPSDRRHGASWWWMGVPGKLPEEQRPLSRCVLFLITQQQSPAIYADSNRFYSHKYANEIKHFMPID